MSSRSESGSRKRSPPSSDLTARCRCISLLGMFSSQRGTLFFLRLGSSLEPGRPSKCAEDGYGQLVAGHLLRPAPFAWHWRSPSRETFQKAGAQKVEVIEGQPSSSNLPRECCDGIFIRSVYQNFADRAAMNASLWASLKPGRLAIIDVPPTWT
jgi:hypothetical protein